MVRDKRDLEKLYEEATPHTAHAAVLDSYYLWHFRSLSDFHLSDGEFGLNEKEEIGPAVMFGRMT